MGGFKWRSGIEGSGRVAHTSSLQCSFGRRGARNPRRVRSSQVHTCFVLTYTETKRYHVIQISRANKREHREYSYSNQSHGNTPQRVRKENDFCERGKKSCWSVRAQYMYMGRRSGWQCCFCLACVCEIRM